MPHACTTNVMIFLNCILLVIVVLDTNSNELNEEVAFPQDSLDQQLITEKVDEIVDIFKICEEGLGCIETDQTWYHKDHRPVNFRPLSRHIIKTDFLLIKKSNIDDEQLLYSSFQPKQDSIKRAGFSNNSELIILIHDFTANGYSGWIKHISHKIVMHSMDYNLISIDWQRGAEPPFDQAIANARVVALEIILLIKELKEKMEYCLDNIHIIGHGIGAHIAGYVGGTYNKIKKITGLDPSGPRFEGMPYNVKLNPRCAQYVEVIHTDYYQTRSQGVNETLGHSDFFVNENKNQPGCSDDKPFSKLVSLQRGSLEEGEILPGCSHKRSFKYFIESIGNKNCSFQGIKCNGLIDFKNGKCTSCNVPNRDCRLFGLKSYLETSENNMYFLNTASQPPFCMLEYRITTYIKNKEKYGYFDFILIDENANVSEAFLSAENQNNYRTLTGDTELYGNSFIYFASPPKLHNIRELKVRWNEKSQVYCVVFCKQVITVQKITVSFLGTGHDDASEDMCFCPNTRFIEIDSGSFVKFKRCEENTFTKPQYEISTMTESNSVEKQREEPVITPINDNIEYFTTETTIESVIKPKTPHQCKEEFEKISKITNNIRPATINDLHNKHQKNKQENLKDANENIIKNVNTIPTIEDSTVFPKIENVPKSSSEKQPELESWVKLKYVNENAASSIKNSESTKPQGQEKITQEHINSINTKFSFEEPTELTTQFNKIVPTQSSFRSTSYYREQEEFEGDWQFTREKTNQNNKQVSHEVTSKFETETSQLINYPSKESNSNTNNLNEINSNNENSAKNVNSLEDISDFRYFLVSDSIHQTKLQQTDQEKFTQERINSINTKFSFEEPTELTTQFNKIVPTQSSFQSTSYYTEEEEFEGEWQFTREKTNQNNKQVSQEVTSKFETETSQLINHSSKESNSNTNNLNEINSNNENSAKNINSLEDISDFRYFLVSDSIHQTKPQQVNVKIKKGKTSSNNFSSLNKIFSTQSSFQIKTKFLDQEEENVIKNLNNILLIKGKNGIKQKTSRQYTEQEEFEGGWQFTEEETNNNLDEDSTEVVTKAFRFSKEKNYKIKNIDKNINEKATFYEDRETDKKFKTTVISESLTENIRRLIKKYKEKLLKDRFKKRRKKSRHLH